MEYATQQQQKTHCFQIHVEHLPRQIIFWAIKTSINKVKRIHIIQHIFSDHYGIKLEIIKRYLESSQMLQTKQHSSKQLICQRRHQKKLASMFLTFLNKTHNISKIVKYRGRPSGSGG